MVCGVESLSLCHTPLILWALVHMIKGNIFLISCFVKLDSELAGSGYILTLLGISSPGYSTELLSPFLI